MNDASSKKQPGASSSKGKGGSQKASGKAVKGKKGGKACEVEDVDMADVTKLEQDDRATGAPGISKLNDLEDDTGCVFFRERGPPNPSDVFVHSVMW